MAVADLRSEEEVARAVQGCDAVVHCAIGTTWGNRREIFDVTVQGTKRLVEAALAGKVRRLVHISTFAVHDLHANGLLDESTPIRPPKGNDYCESKAEAEQVIAEAVQRGLRAVTLRLSNVYGPFSQIFIVRPLQYLAQDRLVLVGSPDTPSSTVYVDNVVEAIVRSLECPDEVVNGQVFTISDGDDLTWGSFYGYFAKAMGKEVPAIPLEDYERRKAAGDKRGGLWWAASPFRGFQEVVTSAELRALVKKTLKTEPLYSAGRYVLETIPGLKGSLRRLLKLDTPPIYRPSPPAADAPGGILEFDLTHPLVSIEKARRVLGYSVAVPRQRAMELTLEWLRYARLV
jgi:nucleoside-diphosphate-sugar epimerase